MTKQACHFIAISCRTALVIAIVLLSWQQRKPFHRELHLLHTTGRPLHRLLNTYI